MALEGTLRDFSLADIFQLIGIQRKTGVLTLRNGEEVATISFINGMVVGADTDNQKLENRLGHVLVKTNRISQEELEQALAIQNSTLQRLGQVLISKGFIKKEDLKESLQMQVSEIIYRLFRWLDGDYHFRQERYIDYDQENFTPISSESLLMEGIRMIDEWPMIERVIPNFDVMVERSAKGRKIKLNIDKNLSFQSGPVGSFDDILEGVMAEESDDEDKDDLPPLSHDQEVILKLIDQPIPVHQVIERSRLNEFETCRAIYDLAEVGVVARVSDSMIEKDVQIVQEERPIPTWIPWAAILAVAVVGLLTQWNPINRFFSPQDNIYKTEPFFKASSRYRMKKIARALDVYYLMKGKLPIGLDVLVDNDLISDEELTDPLGRKYTYRLRPEEQSYRMMGSDYRGNDFNQDLVIRKTYTIPGPKDEQEQDSEL